MPARRTARIGLILLFGIVVNNAILLVSRFWTEAGLILKAKLGGDPEPEAALFRDQSKRLGGSDAPPPAPVLSPASAGTSAAARAQMG